MFPRWPSSTDERPAQAVLLVEQRPNPPIVPERRHQGPGRRTAWSEGARCSRFRVANRQLSSVQIRGHLAKILGDPEQLLEDRGLLAKGPAHLLQITKKFQLFAENEEQHVSAC